MSDYSELKRLADAATPGPWFSNSVAPGDDQDEDPMVYRSLPNAGEKAVSVLFNADWATDEDAAFVAACREAVPNLISKVERITERLCVCLACAGQGEVYSGRSTYHGYNQPPEPDMDVCGTCGGDGVLGPIEDFEAVAAERDNLKTEVDALREFIIGFAEYDAEIAHAFAAMSKGAKP